jgi:hypothetical protein
VTVLPSAAFITKVVQIKADAKNMGGASFKQLIALILKVQ